MPTSAAPPKSPKCWKARGCTWKPVWSGSPTGQSKALRPASTCSLARQPSPTPPTARTMPDDTDGDRILARIARQAGVPDLVELLAERLAPSDLHSLLLEVTSR